MARAVGGRFTGVNQWECTHTRLSRTKEDGINGQDVLHLVQQGQSK